MKIRYQYPSFLSAIVRRVHISISNLYWKVINGIVVYFSGITYGKDLHIGGKCYLMARCKSDVVFGNNVTIESRFFANIVGLMGPSVFHTLCGGHIEVGDDTGMSAPILSSRNRIVIGKRCRLGGNVRVYDHDFHSLEAHYRSSREDSCHVRTKPVIIGDDVFIGTNAVILKGTKIGDRSIVAAGSVVFGLDVPPDSLVKGNPAVIIVRNNKS